MDPGEVPIKTILNEKVIIRYYDDLRAAFISYFRKKYNLDTDTISDIYQETYYIVFKKVKHNQLAELSCTLKTFVYSIGSNLLLNELRSKRLLTNDLEKSLESEISLDKNVIEEEEEHMKRTSIVNEAVGNLTDLCKSIIKMFYWEKMKLSDILFKIPGYLSLDALKTQKYKCMKKLEESIKARLTAEGLN
jgi:RNA polymerase sigma factor (sigma-70 family)